MDGWMDGCMDGWMDGWMDGCVLEGLRIRKTSQQNPLVAGRRLLVHENNAPEALDSGDTANQQKWYALRVQAALDRQKECPGSSRRSQINESNTL